MLQFVALDATPVEYSIRKFNEIFISFITVRERNVASVDFGSYKAYIIYRFGFYAAISLMLFSVRVVCQFMCDEKYSHYL